MELLILASIVLFAYTTQAMTGFGSTVIALTLGAQIVPLAELLPVLVALNLPLCLWIVIRQREHIDRELLTYAILPWMGAGIAAGLLIARALEGHALRQGFGALVVAVAIRELVQIARGAPLSKPPPWLSRTFLVGSGITHGLWGSGGPLLVLALGPLDRKRFRATLMTVWLVSNAVLCAVHVAQGRWNEAAVHRFLLLLPTIPAGLWLGEWLHTRVPDVGFRLVVQAVLVIAGLALLK